MNRKRVALSVSPEMDALFDRLSILTKKPKTKLILEVLKDFEQPLKERLKTIKD